MEKMEPKQSPKEEKKRIKAMAKRRKNGRMWMISGTLIFSSQLIVHDLRQRQRSKSKPDQEKEAVIEMVPWW
jgi:hypothetical protein